MVMVVASYSGMWMQGRAVAELRYGG